MDGLIAPAGSLVNVNATVFVDQGGTDFIDPTSVEAVVTKQGSSEVLDSTKLATQGGNAYSGRISLGDLATDTYTLTVSAKSSSGVKGSATRDFQIDGGPILFVTSPQALHPYKGLLVVEVLADAGPFGPLDGPHATVANFDVPLMLVGDPNDPNDPNRFTYRGSINLRDPMPPDPAAPGGGAAPHCLGDQRARQAHRSSPRLRHRRGGSDDHADDAGARPDRRRHHAHFGDRA